MEAWLLREWQRTSFWQVLLRPLSWVFALLASARRSLYRSGILKSERIGVPVVVIGNISVGGTGKTPTVLAIVKLLGFLGWRCGIILRGYSRNAATQKAVDYAKDALLQYAINSDDQAMASDEAMLLAKRSGAPVYVSANRAAAARALLQKHPEVNVIISDDGLQHYALHRDLEICVIDGARRFGNGALLPAGPLREPVTRLEEVDAIVVNSTGSSDDASGAILGRPSFSMSLGKESLMRVIDDQEMTIEQGLQEFSTKRVIAVAGIGNPARFFTHMAGLGFRLTETRAFPDHHPYKAADFAGSDVGIVLMTEKDAVKCKAFADDRMWFMRVDAILPEAFGEFLVQRLSELKK